MQKQALSGILAASLIAGCSTSPKSQMIRGIETPEDGPVFIAHHPELGRIGLIVSGSAYDDNGNGRLDYPEEFSGIKRRFEYGVPLAITLSVENPSKNIRYSIFSPKTDFKAGNSSKESQMSDRYYPLSVGTYFIDAFHGNEKILSDWFEVTPRWLNAEK